MHGYTIVKKLTNGCLSLIVHLSESVLCNIEGVLLR